MQEEYALHKHDFFNKSYLLSAFILILPKHHLANLYATLVIYKH